MRTPLADALLAGAASAPSDRDRLETALKAAIRSAEKAHPRVRVPHDALVSFVAARLSPDVPVLDAIGALRIEDLYVACGCASGNEEAIATVERTSFREVDAAVRRLRAPPSVADEIKQMLRERLFVGTPERPAGIGEYAGRGALGRWIHAIATRAAIDVLRRASKDVSVEDALVQRAIPDDDPELELLKRRYRADFCNAIREAMRELSVEARNDLRFYYIDGLSLEDLAGLHRITPSAVSRRLTKARSRVLDRTRALLRERLHVSDEDVRSILRLIESRLDLSASALGPSSEREHGARR